MINRLLAFALLPVFFAAPGLAASPRYEYYRLGSATDAANVTTTAGTVLMGGGNDVDAAFKWMCGLSRSGDFLVIRATGTDAYNPYIQDLCPGANSVATLIIPSRAAAGVQFVADTIAKAEAIFISGGDQSNYINYWKGSPVQTALQSAIARSVPVGGTSAGLNVLTEFVYSALGHQGVTSSQALANPYSKYITLDQGFVEIAATQGMIGDAHFVARDRMGRDLAFLCRIFQSDWSAKPTALAVDSGTALLIDERGNATVVGDSTAYLLQAPGAPGSCAAGTPLTYTNIAVHRISQDKGSLNLIVGSAVRAKFYTVSASNGLLSTEDNAGKIY